jgi:hypothetical protein
MFVMGVRKAGRRYYGGFHGTAGQPQTYDYRSPGVTFESDKLTDEEIEKLSGTVKVYTIKELARGGGIEREASGKSIKRNVEPL